MLNRRTLLGAAALAIPAAAARAQGAAPSWRSRYPELIFGIIPAENASGVLERWKPYTEYLSKHLNTPVTLRIANDYAAVIEGQRAGNIHIASYGPSSFARALMTGAQVTAFAIETNLDGTRGYHSVFYVKKDSPYQKVEDLKGKNFGLVDPNSTSGNNVPRFAFNKMGINPETFFNRLVYTGSHENAVIALSQGTVDACANWWNDENESNLARMARKGMVKAEDFRIIFKSDEIVNSPFAYLNSMPEDLRTAISTATLAMPKDDAAGYNKIYEGKAGPWAPVDNAAYQPIVELNRFVDGLRRPDRRALLTGLVLAAGAVLAGWVAEVDPGRLAAHIGGFFGYFDRILTLETGLHPGQWVWTDPGEWLWGLRRWSLLLADTLLIAYVATLLGGIGGFLGSFATARNLVRSPLARGAAKRLLEFCRTVPDIVFALIFVIAFGLGPLPGVLAIAIHTAGALGKQFSEAVENVDPRPLEGLAAAGASRAALIRFAVLPQVLPNFASYALLRFEVNVRQASVIGFVGAGGIGQDLLEAIRKFYYTDVSAILLLIIAAVMVLDLATERLRHWLMGREHA